MHKRPTSARELMSLFLNCTMHHPNIEEAKAIAMEATMEVTGFTRTDVIADKSIVYPDHKWKQIQDVAMRLKNDEPVQYIFRNTWFYGSRFYTGPGVLIPRPETEELVDLIIRENSDKALNIIDIGTGSGCIAISLALKLKKCTIDAIDVSTNALKIATKNSEQLGTEITFKKVDILQQELEHKYDIIVSNPPYVPNRERREILRNVSSYEPGLALFVPDSDPLLFYRRILEIGTKSLRPNGKIYFEIHEFFGNELIELATSLGFRNVQLFKDMSSKDRILVAYGVI